MKIINNLKTYDHVPHLYTPTSGSPLSTELTRRVTVVLGTVDGKDLVLPSAKGKRKIFTVLNLNSNTIKVSISATDDTITNSVGVSLTTMDIVRYKGVTFEALGGIWYVTSSIATVAS